MKASNDFLLNEYADFNKNSSPDEKKPLFGLSYDVIGGTRNG